MDWALVYGSLRKDIGEVLQDFLEGEVGQQIVRDDVEALVGNVVTTEEMNDAIASAIENVLETGSNVVATQNITE